MSVPDGGPTGYEPTFQIEALSAKPRQTCEAILSLRLPRLLLIIKLVGKATPLPPTSVNVQRCVCDLNHLYTLQTASCALHPTLGTRVYTFNP